MLIKFCDPKLKHSADTCFHFVLPFLPATASQQEPEAEPNSDPTIKASGHSPATQTLPSGAGSISDKSSSPTYMDKSKDSAAVTVT